jgi:two-component system sensor histidine kinase/response regulator
MNASEEPRVRDLARRLSEAETTIEALLSNQIDAVIDSRSQTPVLLSKALAILDEAASVGFDCVLMDVQMPEMDGLECTVIIREREQVTHGHLPIVAMTAHAMAGDARAHP